MRSHEHKSVKIPPEEITRMIGKSVHVSWASFGCVWKLVSIDGDKAHLRTPKTQKRITTKVSDLVFTRADAEKYLERISQ